MVALVCPLNKAPQEGAIFGIGPFAFIVSGVDVEVEARWLKRGLRRMAKRSGFQILDVKTRVVPDLDN